MRAMGEVFPEPDEALRLAVGPDDVQDALLNALGESLGESSGESSGEALR